MNEVKDFLLNNLETVISVAAGLITLIAGLLGINTIQVKRLKKQLQKLINSGYTLTCPQCKKRSPIQDFTFHMPDGSVDDNLNGVADEEE